MPHVLSNHNRVATTREVGQTVAGAQGDVHLVARFGWNTLQAITFANVQTLAVCASLKFFCSEFPWIEAKMA